MALRFLSVLAGVALAATATSAFAFDAVLASAKGLHTHPWHHSHVIEVLPPGAAVNIIAARHGWAEVQTPGGVVGFVHTPILAGAVPAPGWWWGWGAWNVVDPVAPVVGVVATPFDLLGGLFAPAPAPVVATY